MTDPNTAADPTVTASAEVPEAPSEPIRKRRTFTLSELAYETLTAAANAGDGNRSGLVERYIMDADRSVILDADAMAALQSHAAGYDVEPARLVAELVERCGAVLAWQTPPPPRPWWQIWKPRRNGAPVQTPMIAAGR